MNDSISQLLPLADAAYAARQVERPAQERRAVPAVVETNKANRRDETSLKQENTASDKDSLPEMVEALNARMQQMHRGLRFSVDDSSGRIIVKVMDLDTEELIRQIPSEEALRIMRSVSETQNLIFDDQA
jgi:flagellar protein FlaG